MPSPLSQPPSQPSPALAHIRVDEQTGVVYQHLLIDHLEAVADMAGHFAAAFGSRWWGWLGGRWHDLGKFRPGFRRYIAKVNGVDAHLEERWPEMDEKTHSAAGALHALHALRAAEETARIPPVARALAYIIAGHHAGLADWSGGLDDRLIGTGPRGSASQTEYREALAECAREAPQLLGIPAETNLRELAAAIPGLQARHPLAMSMWIRMLFSALCDADFLDTESFMSPERHRQRHGYAPLQTYATQLEDHLRALAERVMREGRARDPVMVARADVLRQCRDKASSKPGVYTLTVPTGGGKTLSSLAFALQHAVAHQRQRVIYAIPYTSIIEQTADVFASIFGQEAIVEHHSQFDADAKNETPRSRLAAENWDAPLIVTTNVQLFESLFAARTSRCRKLHRLANSVIVLDEAQLLPPDLLEPILEALRLLVEHYGVTLVLCTATQPVLTEQRRFDPREQWRGLPEPIRIIDDEPALFRSLARVKVEWPADLTTPISTEALVERLRDEACALVIVNTRADAEEIASALDRATGERTLHLSAGMCGQHRSDTIAEIRARLKARSAGDCRPLRVVSTQLIEAGVDISFPVVYRALAGMDSMAQAAGRCNREGLLPYGRLVVFVRRVGKGGIAHGIAASRAALGMGRDDLLDPKTYEAYFPSYHSKFVTRDKALAVHLLRNNNTLSFRFRTVADAFKLVDDSQQASVIVPYGSPDPQAKDASKLIDMLLSSQTDRWLMRSLQRYVVTIPRRLLNSLLSSGEVTEAQPGVFVLKDKDRYNLRFGLLPDQGHTLNDVLYS